MIKLYKNQIFWSTFFIKIEPLIVYYNLISELILNEFTYAYILTFKV